MVTTIAAMDLIAKALEQKIRTIQAESKEEQDEQVKKVNESIMSLMGELRILNPLILPLVLSSDKGISNEEKSMWISNIVSWAENNIQLKIVPTGVGDAIVIGRQWIQIPKYIDFSKKPHVLLEPYKNDGWEGFATRMMNQLVLGCMMSMPRGHVRVNIINLQWSDKAN